MTATNDDELLSFPDDARRIDADSSKALRFQFVAKIYSNGRMSLNPRITSEARKKYGANMAGAEIITSDTTVSIYVKVGGPVDPDAPNGRVPMKFSETGSSFTLPVTDALKALDKEVPKGRIAHVPAAVAKMVDGSVCIILNMTNPDYRPGRKPKDETEDEQQQQQPQPEKSSGATTKKGKPKSAASEIEKPEETK